MRIQIGFFLSFLAVVIILIVLLFIFLFNVFSYGNPTLNNIASLNAVGIEYKSANGFLDSLIYFDNVTVPAIDIYVGFYNNTALDNYIINELANEELYYLNNSATILSFYFNNNTIIGVCPNKEYINYYVYLDGTSYTFYVCPPTVLYNFYVNYSITYTTQS
ncbi:hypothetical protein DDW05_01405 [Candidatus Nanobsidianus stetteri]|uniref:Uncharacterized protein n=1 Tax=Nanobsidianus stetteri TaxID=1294122 RepID=A0A2T9WTY5_NANST|nr:hypothetical protein DDW05_01405 [Candidatus Nanobsidianus stetteri]